MVLSCIVKEHNVTLNQRFVYFVLIEQTKQQMCIMRFFK